ncbi:MAG: dephospho-CoA kinase [Candidatus Nealsonbacteria bacterium CG_4_10_14_0_2_um_filter_38_17]|uniref:Dephospho-CoA kinase n=2 Tax=Candidatus Nealsoniibacteriota TaxID=1817911 RepID=A0A2M7UYE5_9BACT|nr:MAG: dephospho-CoA kinase [Candidatus Nealsonbacteria bacterium CG23_combo_of_CG06-09_8_20_14_all_38_19]PIZ88895.1 MAG: dephospho-CoA kinase [Candidatus Nealsonbacteria bacterium CG_4_10_14_0_2_um_filter_38_17]
MPNKIICIVGMAGAGKSLVSDELVKKGFSYLRFGQITLDKVKEEGLEPNEANEKKIREDFRKQYGMGAFAILNIPKLDELLQKSNVVVDGLYSWSEYKILKEKYGDSMYVVAVFAPPKLRYERLSNRGRDNDTKLRFRSFTKEEAKARDFAEIENIEKGGPIAMADFTIINTGVFEEIKKKVEEILSSIEKDL